MQSKRAVFLLCILVTLIFIFVGKQGWETYQAQGIAPAPVTNPPPRHPLAGTNSLTNARVERDASGQWFLSFDYFYTGDPAYAALNIELASHQFTHGPSIDVANLTARPGAHTVRHEIRRPGVEKAITTHSVQASLLTGPLPKRVTLATQTVAVDITWPDLQTAQILDELRTQSSEKFLEVTVSLIDEGSQVNLGKATQRLDFLLKKQPDLPSAYLELARVAMKTNWGPEGLRQAESYIDTARKLAPEDPNVWILLGYVYTYQGRYKEAEPLFVASSKTDTPNLWLWTNWGELFKLQGKLRQATQMFQKALDHPPPGNTYDRARHQAYWHLLDLLKQQGNWAQAEALHEQRFREYPSDICFGSELARFMVIARGNATRAIEIGTHLEAVSCQSFDIKETLGLAHYLLWVNAPATEQDPLLNRARIYFPAGTRLIYMLASSEHTEKVLKRLISARETIDQMDNEKMTALAYAMSNKEHDIARRLLKLRARPDISIGAADVPLALIPVIDSDYAGIKLMREFGVDYTKVKYQNMTAFDHARRIGDRKLLEVLGLEQNQRL